MSNYSNCSQASTFSGISSTSRSTSIRCPFKPNFSMESSSQINLTDRLPKVLSNIGRPISQLDETNKAFLQCEEIITDHAIKKLVYECIIEASLNKDSVLTQSATTKLQQLVAGYEIEKYLHLPNGSSDVNEKLNLLGITELPKVEFGYEDKLDIKRLIETKLRTKANSFLSRYMAMGGKLEELTKKSEFMLREPISEVFETNTYHWKERIDQECMEYEKDILEYKKLFSEWINLKYRGMNDIQLKMAESLLVKAQVAEAQAKITRLNCIMKMFKETPMTLKAYQTINSTLDSQISEIEEEIQKQDTKKKLYEDLSGTEYDQVAQKYLQLCKAIEKKERIMKDL